MKTTKLENFRENDFGQIAFLLATSPPTTLQINFDLFVVHAYRFTTKNLRDLENSQGGINNGLQNLPAVEMWYQSIHSFLNVLIQLFCMKKGIVVDQVIHQAIENKYKYLLTLISVEYAEAEKTLGERLTDLTQFEYGLKIPLLSGDVLRYRKANFSARPTMLNQTDILQCMLIALEVFQRFRFIIAGLDLMPSVSLMVNNHIVFDKLDTLFRSVINPGFKDILSKQKLTVDLDLNEEFINYPVSDIFNERDVLIICKMVEDEKFKQEVIAVETDIMGFLFNQFSKKFEGYESKSGRNYFAPGFDPLGKKV